MWSFALFGGCIVLIALLAVYVPTIYIRKTNKLLEAPGANCGQHSTITRTHFQRGDSSIPNRVRQTTSSSTKGKL